MSENDCHNLECYFQLNTKCSLEKTDLENEEIDMKRSFDCPKINESSN